VKGCPDTSYQQMNVHQPAPEFLASSLSGCTPLDVSFTNTTVDTASIVSWIWNFGEGTTDTLFNHNGIITYSNVGAYGVSLTATDTFGCTNTNTTTITSSLPVADFNTSNLTYRTCVGNPVSFANLSTVYLSTASYSWDFGDGTGSNDENPSHTYQGPGLYTVKLDVNDGGCLDSKTEVDFIEVISNQATIIANYNTSSCAPILVELSPDMEEYSFMQFSWSVNGYNSNQYTISKNFLTGGPHEIILYINGIGCFISDTISLEFGEAEAELSISDHSICKGEEVSFSVTDTFNLGYYIIDFGDGNPVYNVPSATHQYLNVSPNEIVTAYLVYWDADSTCKNYTTEEISILNVDANFFRGTNNLDTASCGTTDMHFFGNHLNGDSWWWEFGDGGTSNMYDPQHRFQQPGIFDVTFYVYNIQAGCTAQFSQPIYIWELPQIEVTPNLEICPGDSIQIWASGGTQYLWYPDEFIDNIYSSSPIIDPPYSLDYKLTVTTEHNCFKDTIVPIFVQQNPFLLQNDTFLVVGQEVNIPDNEMYNVTYNWEPANLVYCPTCYNPTFIPQESTTFLVTIDAYANNKLCFTNTDSLFIDVYWNFSIDVPSLFTPNGDGANDVIKVNGWGLKELIEFRIYNRWGHEVYYGSELNSGWNGMYKGQIQSNDTYTYIASAKCFNGKVLVKNGTFNLVR